MLPGTPQKDCAVEQGFVTPYYRMCSMMAHTGIHEKPQNWHMF